MDTAGEDRLLILGLLTVGNVFCLVCPFLIPRTLARRAIKPGAAWPRFLRNKWTAVALIVLFLWAYEAFALWDSPWWTACLALTYFLGAFLGGRVLLATPPFANTFVQSVNSTSFNGWCRRLKSRCVIRAFVTSAGQRVIRGREIPAANCICMFRAKRAASGLSPCAWIVFTPVPTTTSVCWRSRRGRSCGKIDNVLTGRWSTRSDLAALIVVLTFGAFANAAGMVEPVLADTGSLRC